MIIITIIVFIILIVIIFPFIKADQPFINTEILS